MFITFGFLAFVFWLTGFHVRMTFSKQFQKSSFALKSSSLAFIEPDLNFSQAVTLSFFEQIQDFASSLSLACPAFIVFNGSLFFFYSCDPVVGLY